eukprot:7342555-Lingulodinium_polyedra.AAC.1
MCIRDRAAGARRQLAAPLAQRIVPIQRRWRRWTLGQGRLVAGAPRQPPGQGGLGPGARPVPQPRAPAAAQPPPAPLFRA